MCVALISRQVSIFEHLMIWHCGFSVHFGHVFSPVLGRTLGRAIYCARGAMQSSLLLAILRGQQLARFAIKIATPVICIAVAIYTQIALPKVR